MPKLPHGQVLVVVRQQRVQDLVEAVHVQLTNKRRHIAVLEVVQERVGELLAGIEGKRVAVFLSSPPDEMGQLWVVEHPVELVHEGVFLDGGILLRSHGWMF